MVAAAHRDRVLKGHGASEMAILVKSRMLAHRREKVVLGLLVIASCGQAAAKDRRLTGKNDVVETIARLCQVLASKPRVKLTELARSLGTSWTVNEDGSLRVVPRDAAVLEYEISPTRPGWFSPEIRIVLKQPPTVSIRQLKDRFPDGREHHPGPEHGPPSITFWQPLKPSGTICEINARLHLNADQFVDFQNGPVGTIWLTASD